MKTLARSILITGILAIFASSSMIAQTGNSSFENWYRAKYGRPAPTEQVRLDTRQEKAATPEATSAPVAVAANGRFEQWYRVKYGRPSPTEEARLTTQQVNPASSEATRPTVAVSANGGQASPRHTPMFDKSQLNTLITTAKTPTEHQRIAESYRDQAQDYLARSAEHTAMIASYKANPALVSNKNQTSTTIHCENLVQEFKGRAEKAQELARMHEQMASDSGTQGGPQTSSHLPTSESLGK